MDQLLQIIRSLLTLFQKPAIPESNPPEIPDSSKGKSMSKKINQDGLNLIKQFEGLRLQAYPDPGTGGEPITIGYGHTGGVKMGDSITQDQADAFLAKDCEKFESGVEALIGQKIGQINDNQFSAMVVFSYNVGLGNLKSSTLLKKVLAGDNAGAADEFPKWNKAAGKELPGLTKRRAAEKALFLS